MNSAWPWVLILLLGAYHGLNPAMGWLFALALALQEKRRATVLTSLGPIALGHAAAIAIAILVLSLVQHILPVHSLKWPVAVVILALGMYRLFRASHPRGSGMRVGARGLFVWSFLMASAHGAGLMVVPVLLAHPMLGMSHSMATPMHAITVLSMRVILLATLVHTAAMLLVAGILALIFYALYEKAGLRVLRHAWVNFDLLWAIALLVAGVAVLLD